MKNFLALITLLIFLGFSHSYAHSNEVSSDIFKVGISIEEQIPKAFFGTWRVVSSLTESNSPKTFKANNIDIWNLSKEGNVVNLSNPFSGANASITLTYAGQDAIRFTKKNNYDGRILTDTVELKLDNNKFSGVNTILLETLSDIDNSVIKSETATYTLKGEKIAGEAITKENKWILTNLIQ